MVDDHSDKHKQVIETIMTCEDYYEILDVHEIATEEEIHKAYKKLAVLVHPDKNKHPDATKAFQLLGSILSILTDAKERENYDWVLKRKREEKQYNSYNDTTGFSNTNERNYENKSRQSSYDSETYFDYHNYYSDYEYSSYNYYQWEGEKAEKNESKKSGSKSSTSILKRKFYSKLTFFFRNFNNSVSFSFKFLLEVVSAI